MKKWKFILASQSPRRKELLEHLRIPFEIMPANVDETTQETNPEVMVKQLGLKKALAVANLLEKSNPFLVLASDTTVEIDGSILEKPADRREAKTMLEKLSGKAHRVFTSIVLVDHQGRQYCGAECSLVTFDQISPFLLNKYLDSDEPYDKAGAYGIQGPALAFISRLEGCYANVMGLPLTHLRKAIDQFFSCDDAQWRSLF